MFIASLGPEFTLLVLGPPALLAAALFLINVVFAIGVMRDGDRIRERGGDTFLVGPTAWMLATLFGSIVVIALYWLVHHSSFRAPSAKPIVE
jgi:hypothetical protein